MIRRSALITGGSAGIGLAIASVLVSDDWDVTIAARNEEKLTEAVAVLGEGSGKVHAVTAKTPYFAATFSRGDAHADAVERICQHHHRAVVEWPVAELVTRAGPEVVERQGATPARDRAARAAIGPS